MILRGMSLDHYVTLGHSGLRVSPLCLGAMTFGEDWGWGSSRRRRSASSTAYLERGGNFIDTANVYTKGHSEKIIGDHLAHDRKKRDRVVIATKFVTNLFLGDPNGGGASRKAIIAQCEESLRRLQTDYIDLYWMHAWDKTTPIEETMRALDDARRAGQGPLPRLLRHAGVEGGAGADDGAPPRLGAAHRAADRVLAARSARSRASSCRWRSELGLGVTPWGPLRGGALSGKYTRADTGKHQAGRGARVTSYLDDRTFDLLDLMARSRRSSTRPSRASRSRGCRAGPASPRRSSARARMEQLDDNLGALDVKLTADAGRGARPRPASRRCRSPPTCSRPSPRSRTAARRSTARRRKRGRRHRRTTASASDGLLQARHPTESRRGSRNGVARMRTPAAAIAVRGLVRLASTPHRVEEQRTQR